MNPFKAGQEVICIDNNHIGTKGSHMAKLIKKGDILTVDGIQGIYCQFVGIDWLKIFKHSYFAPLNSITEEIKIALEEPVKELV